MIKILTPKERLIFGILTLILIISTAGLIIYTLTNKNTAPDFGGTYREGVIGQPRYINPVLAQTNDADRDLSQIIFSSLFKYNEKSELAPDLAKDYEIKENGLVYEVRLKENNRWHDNEPIKADDIVFTIKTIQNPDFNSPLRISWQGVEIEKIDDWAIRFKLKNIYAPFLHNLTVGILPQHLWGGISAQNFVLAEYNLEPVGSGPYKFKKLTKDKSGRLISIELIRNENYYLSRPYLEKIVFNFYQNEEEANNALKNKKIDGLSFINDQSFDFNGRFIIHKINLPIYYAVFFNQNKSLALADKNLRLALSYATNKTEIIDRIAKNKASLINSPILENWLGYSANITKYEYSLEQAKDILENNGWKDKDGDGIREKTINKQEIKLEIALSTVDVAVMTKTADLLKEQWEKIGAKINIELTGPTSIQEEIIRPREYEALLFGEVLGADPDPFSFWHSSQKKDPGLNLALYQNKNADKLLEEARQILEPDQRNDKYIKFQELLVSDAPAVFLYSPIYLYPVDKKIKGIVIEKLSLPSYRFSQIEKWYIETKRVEK